MNLKLKSEIIAPRRLFDWKYFLFVWFVKLFAIYWLINVYWAQPRHFYKASKTPKKLWYNIQKSLDPKSGETGINAVIFSDYPWFLCIVVSIFHFSSSFVFLCVIPCFHHWPLAFAQRIAFLILRLSMHSATTNECPAQLSVLIMLQELRRTIKDRNIFFWLELDNFLTFPQCWITL